MDWTDFFLKPIPLVTIVFFLSAVVSQHSRPFPPPAAPRKLAFVTLATPAFAIGAVTLGFTLSLHHGDRYDRVCLVTRDLNSTWRLVLSQWWLLRPVADYVPMVHFQRSWAKLQMWDMTEHRNTIPLRRSLT
jgi:hypothetical protein